MIKKPKLLFLREEMQELNIKTLNEMKKREWWRIADVGDYPLCIALSLVGKVRYLSDVMSVYRFQHIGSWTYSHKKTNINHKESEIRWMQILVKDTNRKYHKAIQRVCYGR